MLELRGRSLQVAIVVSAGSAYLLFGYDQGVLGGLVSQPSFLSAIGNPSSQYLGTIVALFNIGCLGGCLVSAIFGNQLGRKRVITLGCVIMTIGGAIQASTYGAGQLIAGRIVSGIGNGMNTTIQALLLLIHWNDLPDAEKDTSHWMGICLSLAMSIGLHHSPDNTAAMTPSQRQTWRRTWWSVYNHARLTAEDLVSMMSIEEDCGDSELAYTMIVTLNDFQFGVYSPEARAIVDDCEVLRTIEYQKSQALVFIEKTKLCRLAQFSRVSNQVSKLVHGTDSPETKVSSKRNSLHPDEAGDLHRWLSQLPSNARHQYPLALTPTEWERSIHLHRTWLRLLYLGSAYAACCDEFRAAGNPFLDPMMCPRSEPMNQYLLDITDLFDEIDSLGLTKHLPSPSTALLILVLTFHWRLVDTGTPLEQAASARTLHKCWNMMHKLQETSKLGVRMIALVRDTVCTDIWERLSSKLLSS